MISLSPKELVSANSDIVVSPQLVVHLTGWAVLLYVTGIHMETFWKTSSFLKFQSDYDSLAS